MGRGEGGASPPSSERLALLRVLPALALGVKVSDVPFHYVLEYLARRWHIAPWELEDAPIDWLIRGLEYQSLEASVEVKRNG